MSSPWGPLLECLHSTLIDELVERHPEPKPELGVPRRQAPVVPPVEASGTVWLIDVSVGVGDAAASKGYALFAHCKDFEKIVGAEFSALWEGMSTRLPKEQGWRKLKAEWGAPRRMARTDWEKHAPALRLAVWIPLRCAEGECHLAVAV